MSERVRCHLVVTATSRHVVIEADDNGLDVLAEAISDAQDGHEVCIEAVTGSTDGNTLTITPVDPSADDA